MKLLLAKSFNLMTLLLQRDIPFFRVETADFGRYAAYGAGVCAIRRVCDCVAETQRTHKHYRIRTIIP